MRYKDLGLKEAKNLNNPYLGYFRDEIYTGAVLTKSVLLLPTMPLYQSFINLLSCTELLPALNGKYPVGSEFMHEGNFI